MCNYMRFGGCRVDISAAWLDATRKVVAGLPQFVDEFDALLSTNEILMARCQGIGVLRPELAVNAGVTGPMLRGSGVNYDIRKVDHTASTIASRSACRWATTGMSMTAT